MSRETVGLDLACLPVFIMACNTMLVLAGETFATRLWCAWEMYTFFAICPNKNNRICIASLDSDSLTHQALGNFELSEAKCTSKTDEDKLRSVITAGGQASFENAIRNIGQQVGETMVDSHES